MDKFIAAVKRVRKAIVAAVSVVVTTWLLKAGVDIDNDTVSTVITGLVSMLTVYFVPNARKYVEDEGEYNE